MRRTLDLVRPRLFIMMETEIWPNLLRECRQRGIKTAVVNGRLSPRSFPRYKMVRPMMRRVLDHIDRFCVQSEESARRFIDLGADPARVVVTGSLKFDSLDLPSTAPQARARDRVLRYFRLPPTRPVLVVGSTMKGEEAAVLRAFRRVRASAPNTLLVLAPRNPERFGEAEQLARAEGWKVARRSDLAIDAEPRVDVVVLDTIGELATVYQIATVVFVGGSLVATGGHNVLEPAVFGKPIVFGPHMENFIEIADAFVTNGAGVQVARRARARRGVRVVDGRSGAARAARRRGPRPGRSQSRRQGEERRGAGGAAPAGSAFLSGQRPALQTPCLIPSTAR